MPCIKFCPELCQKILMDIKDCIPNVLAATSNGICEDTLYEWLKVGLKDIKDDVESEHAKFFQSFKKVEADRIRYHIEKINSNCDRWQADAWILERRWWKHFSPSAPIIEMQEKLEKLESEKLSKDV